MTERSADQVIEVNLFMKARDFVNHALGTSVNYHCIDVSSQEILVARAAFGIDVSPEQPLGALTCDLNRLRIGGSNRDQPRHRNFTAFN